MGAVFFGVICSGKSEFIRPQLGSRDAGLHPMVEQIAPGISLVSYNAARHDTSLDSIAAADAQLLSAHCGPCLIIEYDDRVGYRASTVYRNGRSARRYAGDDELYVELVDTGYPRSDLPPIRAGELMPDKEYETIENAIQLGLRELGYGNLWETVFQRISGADPSESG